MDTSRYPCVIQRWKREPTQSDLQAYFVFADELADRAIAEDSYYVVIVEGATGLSVHNRRVLAQWVDAVPAARRRRTLGSFVVIQNAGLRGIFTALKWLTKNLDDVVSVATVEEGLAQAQSLLAKRQLST